jgi:hypothetical protein
MDGLLEHYKHYYVSSILLSLRLSYYSILLVVNVSTGFGSLSSQIIALQYWQCLSSGLTSNIHGITLSIYHYLHKCTYYHKYMYYPKKICICIYNIFD